MRVLQISSRLDGGGAERVALSLTEGLAAAGVTVRGLCFYAPRLPVPGALETALALHCRILGKTGPADVGIYSRLRNEIRLFQPDVIHCHLSVLKYVWPATLQLRRIPIVHTVHSLACFDARTVTRLANLCAFRFGRVIPVGVSAAVARSVEATYHLRSCRTIYNGVLTPGAGQGRAPWRAAQGIDPASIVFVWAGSLAPPKLPGRVLEAFARASRGNSGMRLIIAGTGPMMPELKSRVAQLSVGNQVSFLGYVANIGEVLAAADVFVHCSAIEGDPMSIKEAMSMGLPVLAASAGGIPEVVQDGVTGYLCRPDDRDSLTHWMRRLAGSESERRIMGAAGRNLAGSRFTLQRMTSDYMELYETMVRARRA